MIETHTVCDPAATIVTRNREVLMSELPHHFDLILCHYAKGVIRVVQRAHQQTNIAVSTAEELSARPDWRVLLNGKRGRDDV